MTEGSITLKVLFFDSMSNKFYHKKSLSQGYVQRYKSKNCVVVMKIMLKL